MGSGFMRGDLINKADYFDLIALAIAAITKSITGLEQAAGHKPPVVINSPHAIRKCDSAVAATDLDYSAAFGVVVITARDLNDGAYGQWLAVGGHVARNRESGRR